MPRTLTAEKGENREKKRSIWKLVRKADIMETISAGNVGKQDHVLESWLTQTCTAALHPRVWEIWGPGDSEFTRVYVVQSDFLILWLMGFVLVCVQQQPHKDGADFRRARASRNTRGAVLFLSQRKVSAAFLTLSPPHTQTHTFPWCMSYLKHGDVRQRNLKLHRTHSELCLCLPVFWCGGLWECFVLLSCFWSRESEMGVCSF